MTEETLYQFLRIGSRCRIKLDFVNGIAAYVKMPFIYKELPLNPMFDFGN